MVYLDSLLSADGRISFDVEKGFKELAQIWKHANITRYRKCQIYETCILSKLMVDLHIA